MGLFNFKKKNEEAEETQAAPRNPNTMIMIRILAVGYIMWMYKDMIQMYIEGGADAPSLTMLLITGVIFIGGSIWIGITTWKQYKTMKAEMDEYNEMVAEQYRLEEEAAAAETQEDYEEVNEEPEEE